MKEEETNIIISLERYEKMKKVFDDYENELSKMKNNYEKNVTTLYHSSRFEGVSGYPVHTYRIVTDNEVILALNNDLKDINEQNYKLRVELQELRYKKNKWI